jgi:hypothetical protein
MKDSYKWIIGVIALIFLAALAYSFLTMPDKRNSMEKIGDAIHDMPQGAEKAERQLEDRTPGQKLGDAVKDAGETIKDNTDSAPTPPATVK